MQVENPSASSRPGNDRVYVFLDESGNLDFSASGTRYFVLTSVSMKRPFQINEELDGYMYDCIENGMDIEYFHCYSDNRRVRDVVFDLIAEHVDSLDIDCLVVEKSAVAAGLQTDVRFYPAMFGRLLRLATRFDPTEAASREVVVISDTVPINRGRRAVEKTIQTTLRRALPSVRHHALHHQSRSHYGLQIADYCSWAIFRKWEVGDSSWFARIEPAIRHESAIVKEK